MKRLFNLLAVVLSVALLVSVTCMSAIAVEDTSIDGEYTISIPYDYPVQPGTNEWFALETHSDRVAVSQIPDEILTHLTTDALVESVVNYPFLTDMGAFSTPELGYAAVRDNFNGLAELEQRHDGAYKLLEYYNTLKNQRTDFSFLRFAAIEIALMQREFSSQLAQVLQENTFIPDENMRILFPEANISVRLNYPKTPSGNPVNTDWCYYDRSEMFQSDRIVINKEVLDNYGLSPLRQPTTKYNCHSYAWYNQSSTNKWWINYPDDFMDDSYYRVNQSLVSRNNIAVYRTSSTSTEYLHSGIVAGVSQGSGTAERPPVTITSKWGVYGLYEHNIYNCPSDYGRNVIYYTVA